MKPFARIGSVVFGIVALAHLCRLIAGFDVEIGETDIPHWVSIPALILALVLCIGLWRESKK